MNTGKYIGIPFLEHGRSVRGVDCWGLCRLVYEREYGIRLPALTAYDSTESSRQISEIIEDQRPHWMKVDAPKEGDIIVIRVAGYECHVGIYLSKNRMLHAFKNINSCIERLSNPAWKSRITGYYRYEQ